MFSPTLISLFDIFFTDHCRQRNISSITLVSRTLYKDNQNFLSSFLHRGARKDSFSLSFTRFFLQERSIFTLPLFSNLSKFNPKVVYTLSFSVERHILNIFFFQGENEYGSIEQCDHQYLAHLQDLFMTYLGKDVVLFTNNDCASRKLECGTLPGMLSTLDFGGGYVNRSLASILPRGHSDKEDTKLANSAP